MEKWWKVLLLVVLVTPLAEAQGAEPLKLAIAGLSHGHVHGVLSRVWELPVRIVGIYEPDRDLLARAEKRYGLPVGIHYSDFAAMLDQTHPEAVAAYNPVSHHLEVVEACAPRKIHVMVEKPLAFSAEDARRIQALARKHDIYVLTNYETTWYPTTAELDRRVRVSGEISQIRKIVVHDGHQGPREIGVGPEFLTWLTDPVLNGAGALVDFGCYGTDLALWLLKGMLPETVTAVTQRFKPLIYPLVDDEATIILAYPEAQAIVQASWNWPFNRKDIEVYGTGGYLFGLDRERMRARLSGEPAEVEYLVELSPPFTDPFEYLRSVVHGETDVLSDDLSSLELNVSVARILDAAIRSAREGRSVRLE